MDFEIIIPLTTRELLDSIKKLQKNKFRFGAGCTDLLMELKKNPLEDLTIINLSQIKDNKFTGIKKHLKSFQLGALFTAHQIVVNEELKQHFPVLHQAALNLASTQIRQVATLGGNLCTASPSGDITCALMALEASCELLDYNEKIRVAPITAFFTGVRKTVLQKNEVLYRISIPSNNKNTKSIISGFIKVGTRRSMECSVVSLAYHIQLDKNGIVLNAGVAIGASAPTVQFAGSACSFLIGKKYKKITEKEKDEFAQQVLSYASPIDDIRASAWYRKEVLSNISKSIFE